nr:Mor transcription activator family protein [Thiomicrorhabdus marina]
MKLWPRRIQEFYEVALNEIEKSGLNNEDAQKALAASICTAISLYMGGKSFYLPASSGLKQAIQDLRISKDFTGFNYPELAKKYRVSEMTIRTAIKRQKALMTEVRKGGR